MFPASHCSGFRQDSQNNHVVHGAHVTSHPVTWLRFTAMICLIPQREITGAFLLSEAWNLLRFHRNHRIMRWVVVCLSFSPQRDVSSFSLVMKPDSVRCLRLTHKSRMVCRSDVKPVPDCRMLKETLALLFLWACLDSAAAARGCSSFFCRKSHRVSSLNGVDPGAPLFITPYLEKGAIDEGKGTFLHQKDTYIHWLFQTLTFFFFLNWHTLLIWCSQEAEYCWRNAWGQCQELRWIFHCQQDLQQQPLLLVLPCIYGEIRLLFCSRHSLPYPQQIQRIMHFLFEEVFSHFTFNLLFNSNSLHLISFRNNSWKGD